MRSNEGVCTGGKDNGKSREREKTDWLFKETIDRVSHFR